MPKGMTSRPTNRAVKKIMNRPMNKSIKGSSGNAGYYESTMARGSDAGTKSLAEKRREARKSGAAFDRQAAKKLRKKKK